MTDSAKRRPDFGIYSVKKIPRGEKHVPEDYVNICSVWLDEKYDATLRPECSFDTFAKHWNEAQKGKYGTVSLRIRGLHRQSDIASQTEAKNYASKIIETVAGRATDSFDDYDDIPF